MMGEDDLCVPDTICNYRHHSIILGDIAPCFLEMAPCKSLHPTLRCGNPGSVGGAGSRNAHCKNQETDTSTGTGIASYNPTVQGMG